MYRISIDDCLLKSEHLTLEDALECIDLLRLLGDTVVKLFYKNDFSKEIEV